MFVGDVSRFFLRDSVFESGSSGYSTATVWQQKWKEGGKRVGRGGGNGIARGEKKSQLQLPVIIIKQSLNRKSNYCEGDSGGEGRPAGPYSFLAFYLAPELSLIVFPFFLGRGSWWRCEGGGSGEGFINW